MVFRKKTVKACWIFLWLQVLYPSVLPAQDTGFIRFLMKQEAYHKVLLLLDEYEPDARPSFKDSLHYYRGIARYYLQDLDQANRSFEQVASNSRLYSRAQFFASWDNAYLGRIKQADTILQMLQVTSPAERDLLRYELTGIALLQHDVTRYHTLRSGVQGLNPAWQSLLPDMDARAKSLENFKPKSTVLAGLGSALIPGLGKIYTGQTGAGISSFLLVSGLAAMTVEQGLRSGWTHWNTLLFGGLFLLFHTGNIYGSIISVHTYRNQFYDEINQRILWDMHMPLRDYYRE